MAKQSLLLLFVVFWGIAHAQSSDDSLHTYRDLQNLLAKGSFSLIILEGGCFSKSEFSVSISKKKNTFFYKVRSWVWNSTDRKRFYRYPIKKASTKQLKELLQINNEYLKIKQRQNSSGRILYNCDGQRYAYVTLKKGHEEQRIEDETCEVKAIERLQKVFRTRN